MRRMLGRPLDRRVAGIQDRVESLHADTRDLRQELRGVTASLQAVQRRLDDDIYAMLRALVAEHSHNRRALFELRRSAEYETAFTTEQPLVSITLTTQQPRAELLCERALPSVLSQDYSPLEVVVVSDDGATRTREAVERVGDERIRYFELTNQIGYPDRWSRFLSGGMLARNYAHTQARGKWILDVDDDDALRAGGARALLDLARTRRAELTYGIMERHAPDGTAKQLGAFPPGPSDPDWRENGLPYEPWDGAASGGALFHAGLAGIFGREYISGVLRVPGDYFRLERMVRAGVRFAMLDQVVYDYYPALLWDELR